MRRLLRRAAGLRPPASGSVAQSGDFAALSPGGCSPGWLRPVERRPGVPRMFEPHRVAAAGFPDGRYRLLRREALPRGRPRQVPLRLRWRPAPASAGMAGAGAPAPTPQSPPFQFPQWFRFSPLRRAGSGRGLRGCRAGQAASRRPQEPPATVRVMIVLVLRPEVVRLAPSAWGKCSRPFGFTHPSFAIR